MVFTRKKDYGEAPKGPYRRPGDPSKPPKYRSCLFMRLPGEIRNRIYQYVLMAWPEDVGIRGLNGKIAIYMARPVEVEGPEGTTSKRQLVEVNQLQYVCKRLHQETKGYALAFNPLHFIDDYRNVSLLNNCVRFFQHVHWKWYIHLRYIIIIQHGLSPRQCETSHDALSTCFDFDAQMTLFRICKRLPWVQVNWVCPMCYLFANVCGFAGQAVHLTDVYRGIDLREDLGMDTETPMIVPYPWVLHDAGTFLAPPNFSIYPYDLKDGRIAFTKAYGHALKLCAEHDLLESYEDAVHQRVHNWFENGI